MTDYPLPTQLNLDHPLRFDVRDICVDGVPVHRAVELDQQAGSVRAYCVPARFDETGEPVTVVITGAVTFGWSASAQQTWNRLGGAA